MLESFGTADEITVQELKRLQDTAPDLVLLDCREPEEIATAAITGAVHIPMRQIPARANELSPDAEIVVFCHHGMRSLQVTRWLRQQAGFPKVKSLRGGIDAWSREIDPTVPRY